MPGAELIAINFQSTYQELTLSEIEILKILHWRNRTIRLDFIVNSRVFEQEKSQEPFYLQIKDLVMIYLQIKSENQKITIDRIIY